MTGAKQLITAERFDAVLFDLDGVLTDTAQIHADCWKRTFDEFLRHRADENREPFQPFEIETDYRNHVDGKRRLEGVRDFLTSRDIHLPEGSPDDSPDRRTVCGLGNRKNNMVNEAIRSGRVRVYDSSIALVHRLQAAGIRTAVVSSSRNCQAVLRAVGIAELFKVVVDGEVAADLNLPGKPAPDTFLEAARRLAVEPTRAVVVEDAIAGVQSGRAGGFGLVIGVNRKADADALRKNGADIVVADLGELME